MYLHRFGHFFLPFILFLAGCAYSIGEKPVSPPREPSVMNEAYQESFQEKAQKLRLQKGMAGWEVSLNNLMDSLQIKIKENNALIEESLLTDEQGYLSQKNEVLLSYLGKLERIKILIQRLNESDTALSRESVYINLIDDYLTCLTLFEKAKEDKFASRVDRNKIKEEIKKNFLKGNFSTVIDLYEHLSINELNEENDLKTQAFYILSLNRSGRVEEALIAADDAFEKEFFVTCENASLMYELGEWLIDMERYKVAQKIFQRIIRYYQSEREWLNKAIKKASLFRSNFQYLKVRNKIDQASDLFEKERKFPEVYSLLLDAQENCPDLGCREEVQAILTQFVEKTIADIDENLRQVDEKIEESRILEAQEILSSLEESFPGEKYPPLIVEKLVLIQEKGKILHEEEIKWQDEFDRQRIEKANTLLESENFEEAIILFNQLQGTSYQAEAEINKQLAIDQLARKRRTKAGQLFFQARHSVDPEIKKTYLVESYSLLKSVIDSYPNNQYAEKIRKNLEDVRAEIENIYPEFFLEENSSEESSPRIFEEKDNISEEEPSENPLIEFQP